MKVALVHDTLLQYGGAERMLEFLLEFYPEAKVFTLAIDYEAFPEDWRNYRIKSLLPFKFPYLKQFPQLYGPYLVGVMQRLDLSEYDLVISSDIIFGKMVICGVKTRHVCYQYSPAEMLYEFLEREERGNWIRRMLTGWQKHLLRQAEFYAAQRVDKFLTISQTTQVRVEKYYRREAEVVYAGVEIPSEEELKKVVDEVPEYFLIVSRLVPDKRVDLAVKVCSQYGLNLVVAGVGSEREYLESIASSAVRFVGYVNDKERAKLFANCKALIFPAEDDLGLTPIECQAWGRGVIAYGRGGALETVKEGVTGVFFEEQTEKGLYEAIRRFEGLKISWVECRKEAERFSKQRFKERWERIIDVREVGRVG